MADKSIQLVLDGLSRAMTDPGGLALYGSKATPGLFARTAPARQAAQRCKDEGFLHVVRSERRGKTVHEVCALTDKGRAYLLSQVSPRRVLEDVVRALDARQNQVTELLTAVRQWQASFEALRASAEQVLQQIQKPAAPATPAPSANGAEAWLGVVLDYLTTWKTSGASEDCPLPDLFRRAQPAYAALTIGRFHDGLRRLHGDGQIYLHPWTGPLYEIPEPPYALLVGHEVAYYASRR